MKNLQNSFACSQNYTEYVLNIIKLDILLVLFLVGYLNAILILEKKKFLKNPLDIGEFMRWIGWWLYMACWFGMHERNDCWSVTLEVMHRGAPFRLKNACLAIALMKRNYKVRGG